MLDKFINAYCRVLNYGMAAALALMVVLVFGNVVLRYGFNSGIAISEELSRWLFVWITFMGGVVALKDHAHLGSDMLVGKLPIFGKKICLGVAHLMMLFICWLIFQGTWEQTKINIGSTSAAMEVSMGYFYSVGLVFAVLGGLIILRDFWRLVSGQMQDSELVAIQESEESAITTAPTLTAPKL